ncbi:hypothetical protein D9758_009787 [Tetrapyrgos nigripes]|uniref:Uncharacterized protein n=1 Tax=Tetrapyrgos nigripes TaxID=182062 RepID=A0A8H5GK14_9AGAR|nr:hypothetical protein D9758_009787 [Tetrapyrgos nigripes]
MITLILRIYALYERSRSMLVIMAVTNLSVMGITTWKGLDQGSTRMEPHPEGCVVTVPLDTSLVFLLTLWKSWSMRHYHGFNAQVPDPLIALLFRDGAMYYAFKLLATLANIITYYAYTTEPLSTFTLNFSSIMVSHMLLNLHKSVDEGIFSRQRLIDIDIVPTIPWSESRDLDLETVPSLRRRNGRVHQSIILDTIVDLDDEISEIERDN